MLIFRPGFLTPKVWFVLEALVIFFFFFLGGEGGGGVFPYLVGITGTLNSEYSPFPVLAFPKKGSKKFPSTQFVWCKHALGLL